MDDVIKALTRAAKSLVHPIILVIVVVPMLVALLVWAGVAWCYWGTWTSAIQNAVVDHATLTWMASWDLIRLASWIAAAVVLAILAPAVILTALLPLLLSAYLNQSLFRYDALSEHADAREMKQIFEYARRRLFLLGLLTGVLYFIPPVNLIAPVYAALAFIHLCLAELEGLRSGARGNNCRG